MNQEELTTEILVLTYQSSNVKPESDPPSLAGVDSVDWSALHHAHGDATDVPALLRAALSDNPKHRDFAFRLLHETIWHQGTVYEASAHVVPFLYRMLQAPETPDPLKVAYLLASLAGGDFYVDVHAFVDKQKEAFWQDILAKKGFSLERERAIELHWV